MKTIEQAREYWAKVAKGNGWYSEPFYVQVWQDKEGAIIDAVSFEGIERDIIVEVGECSSCGENDYECECE